MRSLYFFILAITLLLSLVAVRPAHAATFRGAKTCTQSLSCPALATCQQGVCVLNSCLTTSSQSSCSNFNGTTYCNLGRCIPRTVGLGGACPKSVLEAMYNDPCLPNLKCDWLYGQCNDPNNPVNLNKQPFVKSLLFIIICVAVVVFCVVFAIGMFLLRRGKRLGKKLFGKPGKAAAGGQTELAAVTPVAGASVPLAAPTYGYPQQPQQLQYVGAEYPPQQQQQPAYPYPNTTGGPAYPPGSGPAYPPASGPAYPPSAYGAAPGSVPPGYPQQQQQQQILYPPQPTAQVYTPTGSAVGYQQQQPPYGYAPQPPPVNLVTQAYPPVSRSGGE